MATYQITIEMDNAAFAGDDCGAELARILRDLAGFCEVGNGWAVCNITDTKGNKVGEADFIEQCENTPCKGCGRIDRPLHADNRCSGCRAENAV